MAEPQLRTFGVWRTGRAVSYFLREVTGPPPYYGEHYSDEFMMTFEASDLEAAEIRFCEIVNSDGKRFGVEWDLQPFVPPIAKARDADRG
jgi:hypothetical protein